MNNVTLGFAKLLKKLDHKTAATWALDCAEHILPLFEKRYPKDRRPRKAIQAGRAWVRGEVRVGPVRAAALAAHAAARHAKDDAARAAARAAGHAAATAHVITHAPGAALYGARAAGFQGAAKEQAWEYQHLLAMRKSKRVPARAPEPSR